MSNSRLTLMGADPKDSFGAIAVPAEELDIVSRIPCFLQLAVKVVPQVMPGRGFVPAVHMVNGEELRSTFTTTSAFAPIRGQHFIFQPFTKLIVGFTRLSRTAITLLGSCCRRFTTLGTDTFSESLRSTLFLLRLISAATSITNSHSGSLSWRATHGAQALSNSFSIVRFHIRSSIHTNSIGLGREIVKCL